MPDNLGRVFDLGSIAEATTLPEFTNGQSPITGSRCRWQLSFHHLRVSSLRLSSISRALGVTYRGHSTLVPDPLLSCLLEWS